MKIILLNLPWSQDGRLGVRAGSRWPFTSLTEKDGQINYIPFPFFLAYAASLLKRYKKDVRLIDAIAERLKENDVLDRIRDYTPELIVVETSTPSFKNDLDIIKNMRNELSNCKIALCGPHASVFPKQILEEHRLIDYLLIGEYEFTSLDLANALENNLNLESVPGLAYRKEGKVILNNPRITLGNLDSLPWPEREDVPIYRYNDGFAGLPSPNVQMWTSRGCPFGCIFCLWPQTIYREHKYRKRSAKDIVDEMEYLINRFGFKAIYFDDDIFNVDKKHVLEVCGEMRKRNINVPWAAMCRADLMDEELLKILFSSGMCAVKYGIESANQDILDFCGKNMDLKKTYQNIKLTMQLGIKVHLAFCLGLPKETRQTLKETFDFIQSLRPNSLQFSFATPFPGTEYFEHVKEKGWLLSKDWRDYDGNFKSIVKMEGFDNEDLKEMRIAFSNSINF
jgi:radical SAM superfamily enzyme YgiQ (UPF0313 family)